MTVAAGRRHSGPGPSVSLLVDSAKVNSHYLDHVMVSAGRSGVEASEDIVSGSGQKLLAKGAKLDEATRERLLQNKLAKPLQDCLWVEGGMAPELFGPVAEALLDDYPLLRALCGAEPAVPLALTRLRLSAPLQSLLSVYADCGVDRLCQAVGVSLIARVLARRLLGGDIEAQRRVSWPAWCTMWSSSISTPPICVATRRCRPSTGGTSSPIRWSPSGSCSAWTALGRRWQN